MARGPPPGYMTGQLVRVGVPPPSSTNHPPPGFPPTGAYVNPNFAQQNSNAPPQIKQVTLKPFLFRIIYVFCRHYICETANFSIHFLKVSVV